MTNNLKTETTLEEQTNSTRTLSPERAFVVHFHVAESPNHPPCGGRVEHVSSGRASHFESWPELAEFVARIVAPAQSTEIVENPAVEFGPAFKQGVMQ